MPQGKGLRDPSPQGAQGAHGAHGAHGAQGAQGAHGAQWVPTLETTTAPRSGGLTLLTPAHHCPVQPLCAPQAWGVETPPVPTLYTVP